jgi:hypothetical protein
LKLAASKRCGDPVRGTGVMLSKAVCVALFVAIPGFLGYPAPLNVDRREKALPSADSVHVEIWPAQATTVVSLSPRWSIIATPAANLRSQDGYILTREVQRELRRVGCYTGEINGIWTPSTQRAMQTFMNRVNAVLPLEQPDRVLLVLLKGHPEETCSKPCLSSENPLPDGRCVPSSIATHPLKTGAVTKSKAQSLITGWSAAETASLDNDIPKLPPARLPPPPPKAAPPRSMAATTNRERPSSLTRSAQPRISQRSEREASRPTHQSEFARSLFQRLDNSLR